MIRHVEWEGAGRVAFGAITAVYTPIVDMRDDADAVFAWNATDASVCVSMDGGSSIAVTLPPYSSFAFDARINQKKIPMGRIDIAAPYGLPTLGEVTVTVAR